MTQNVDEISAAERRDQASSSMSGVDTAMSAGASLFEMAQSLRARKVRRGVKIELPAYLMVQSSWFVAFGLQMVLYPYLILNTLNLHGTELGLANLALSGPSVVFLLIGGVVAERASGKPLLMLLHALAAVPVFLLAWAVATDNLSYAYVIAYGVALGSVAAFMMPARDSIINQVVERRVRTGSGLTLQLGVTLAIMAQFAAQTAGLIVAGYADKATRMPSWLGGFTIGPIASWKLLVFQGVTVSLGVVFAMMLARGKKIRTGRTGLISAAMGDIADGFRTVRADGKLWAMTAMMFGVGVFVIGAFLVVLPVINRDIYGLESDGLRDMFVTFWMGAFVASVALSAFKNIKRQGRLMLTAQLFGSLLILLMLVPQPHWVFLVIVFVWGVASGITIAMSRAIVQDAAPTHQLARVLSIYQLGFMAGAPLGAAIMGVMVDWIGPYRIALAPAIGMVTLIIWLVIGTPTWNLKSHHPERR